MDTFHYVDGELCCEETPLREVVRRCGTPAYVYSERHIVNRLELLRGSLEAVDHLVCFSVKSNSNRAVLGIMARESTGADIVSGGELYRALAAGIDPRKIVFSGVGKTAAEIRYGLESDILMFNVESEPELEAIEQTAGQLRTIAPVAFRINPDVDAHTHRHTTTGKKETKFGVPLSRAHSLYRKAAELPHVSPIGIDVHLGSPILSLEPYRAALEILSELIDTLAADGIRIRILDIGGGLGIRYHREEPVTPMQFARLILPYTQRKGLRLIVEPGRFVVGNAGALLTTVTYVKGTEDKMFYVCDAAMNDLFRPAFYEAYHSIVPLRRPDESPGTLPVDVVGPVCETSDTFAKAREMPPVAPGDAIAILSAGAYGFTMASQYNSRPRPCEVMVQGKEFSVVRRRETFEDLVRGE